MNIMKKLTLIAAIASFSVLSAQAVELEQPWWPGGAGTNASTGVASADMTVSTTLVNMIAIQRFQNNVKINANRYTPGSDYYSTASKFAVTRTGGGIGTNHSRPFELTITANNRLHGGFALANTDGKRIPLEVEVSDGETSSLMTPGTSEEFQTSLSMDSLTSRNMEVELRIPVVDALAAQEGEYSDTLTFKVAAI